MPVFVFVRVCVFVCVFVCVCVCVRESCFCCTRALRARYFYSVVNNVCVTAHGPPPTHIHTTFEVISLQSFVSLTTSAGSPQVRFMVFVTRPKTMNGSEGCLPQQQFQLAQLHSHTNDKHVKAQEIVCSQYFMSGLSHRHLMI